MEVRVSEHHTYFVGADEWGWSVWAHNAECHTHYIFEDYTQSTKTYGVFKKNGDGKPIEDRNGKPFVATSAQKIEQMLQSSNSPVRSTAVTKNIQTIKYADWLNDMKNGRDQFGQNQYSNHQDWPANHPKSHAHHIVMKAGSGAAQSFVQRTQAILQNVGIDPVFGYDNFIWAPLWPQHASGTVPSPKVEAEGWTGKGYAEAVYIGIKEVIDSAGYDKIKVSERLQIIGRAFIEGVW